MEAIERFVYIIIIIVVFLYFGINDCENGNTNGNCALKPCVRLVKRDFKYCVIMLLGLLIVVITNRFGDNEKLLDYISFGSTLTSIILSVLAIFMTLLAESKSDETKTRLENLTTTIERASYAIEQQPKAISSIYQEMEARFPVYEKMLQKQDEILERYENRFESCSIDVKPFDHRHCLRYSFNGIPLCGAGIYYLSLGLDIDNSFLPIKSAPIMVKIVGEN